ncbi:hypothetical protein [Moheibacter sediminis]|uniref:Outer membrane protein beta-barrel domain-containing protein n=1 Tax=Moheibacter sediminis TaxID=1434700 RepID=A0A1W2C887_9FLAO|nr:hypothetical protein [Moheibacter sediminis]SMC81360.1 hypothetical protein SAMN06296427_10977 [Moheibacter sediminis]
MKKLAFTLLLIPALAFAQVEETQSGKVSLGSDTKNFFIKNGEGFKLNQYKEVFTNQEAIDRIRRARTNKTFASILTYTGSFGIGFGIGYALSVKDTKKKYGYSGFENRDKKDRQTGWIIAGVGAGITLTSIPLWSGYIKNINKGIELENGVIEEPTTQLKLNVNGNGIGMAYQF